MKHSGREACPPLRKGEPGDKCFLLAMGPDRAYGLFVIGSILGYPLPITKMFPGCAFIQIRKEALSPLLG